MSDESLNAPDCDALMRKIFVMRMNAIAARGSVRELTEQRNAMVWARTDLQGCIARERERYRQSKSGPWIGAIQANIDRWERGINLLSESLIPDIDARIQAAADASQAQGLAAERVIKEAASQIEYMGIANAL